MGSIVEKNLITDDKIDRESFWGFKHIVEQIPVNRTNWKYGSVINSSKDFQFSINVNESIDSAFGVTCVEDQIRFFNTIKNPSIVRNIRLTEDQVMEAFRKEELHDSIIYFYCHAKNVRRLA